MAGKATGLIVGCDLCTCVGLALIRTVSALVMWSKTVRKVLRTCGTDAEPAKRQRDQDISKAPGEGTGEDAWQVHDANPITTA